MRIRLILTSVFALILFAVAGNAQSIVRFNSHTPASLTRAGAPMVEVLDGKPIKAVIHLTKSDKSTPNLLLAAVKGKSFKAIPCGSGEQLVQREGKVEAYLQFELENTLVSGYSISGYPGTCGLLTVRLADGTNHYAKLHFVVRPITRS